MSIPASRLASYRSYNYHHVLVMCATSAAADELVNNSDPDVWMHPPGDNPYARKNIGTNADMQYCVLINGATDATFVINSATWTATTGGDATPRSSNAAVAIEGSMEIVEPKGIEFMDKLVECATNMDVNISSVVYVLKTFFVGYGYNEIDGDFVDTIYDIPGIQFTMIDATGTFTERGGQYQISFVAMAGGGPRLPQYSRIPQSISFTASNTLEGTLRALEAKVQSMYQPYFNCVRAQVAAAMKAANKDSTAALAALQAVTYKIECDDRYKNYTVTNQSQVSKERPGCTSPANISISANSSIEDAIHAIMHSSLEVHEDMAVGDKSTKVKYEYKIHAQLAQTDKGPVVTYTVKPYMQPKEMARVSVNDMFEKASTTNTSKAIADILKDPKAAANVIHFDYIYTGKNIDILDFEIKMAQGLTYLQVATASNTFRDQTEGTASTSINASTLGQSNVSWDGRVRPTPVFFGSQITMPQYRNSHNQSYGTQAAFSLASHSSIEVAGESTIRIVGNTNLLTGINNYTSTQYHADLKKSETNASDTTADTPTTELLTGFGFAPSFAHITIKMPATNDDIALLSGESGDGDYAVDFWFNGFYYIVAVENVFEDGAFTQVLHMIGIPNSNLADDQTEVDNEIDLTQRIADCMQGKAECGQPQPATGGTSNTTVPSNEVKDGQNTGQPKQPTTAADANSASKNTKQLSGVKGWDKAKPEVKTSIEKAAASTGANPVTLAQMAAIESGFGRATVNPTSSARGTFQIVRGTWDGTVNSGQVPGVRPGTSFEQANNADANAAVAATLMVQNQRKLMRVTGASSPAEVSAGDTYLAHFLGVGGAQAVIQADNSSSGSMTVKDAYIAKFGEVKGTKVFNSQKKANGSIINDSTTVGELRARAATSMAKSTPLASTQGDPSTVKRQTNTTTPEKQPVRSTTYTGTDAVSAGRDCRNEQAKTESTTDCNQAKPDKDTKK